MSKSSAQLLNGLVVVCVLNDSKGRVPDGNIPLNVEDPEMILGAKYDSTAEETEEKTMASFTLPAENHYFDEDGNEQQIPTP